MKIKVEVQEWRIEDENGNSPDEAYFTKEKLSLPDEVLLTVNYNDINDVDDIVVDELYKKTGFYPEVFTWVEISD
jgi:hypothetical protein